ncbi:MAG: YjbH domain-containing protein [Armatimonadetes bacterium]|nr:YjbH domain-containing protein [Armatimonadota bacterium]
MSRVLALAVCFAVALAVPAIAQDDAVTLSTNAPSVLGLTGAVVTPTTELPPVKGLNVGYHWIQDTLDGAGKVNAAPIPKVEIGATWWNPEAAGSDDELLFNAKYLFVEEDEKNPAVAAGVIDLSDEIDQTWFGVISKVFNPDGEVPITVNIGGASGDTISGIFGSVKLALHEDVDVIGEYDSEEFNFAVRARPYEDFTIDLLTVDNGTDREFGVGAAWCTTW